MTTCTIHGFYMSLLDVSFVRSNSCPSTRNWFAVGVGGRKHHHPSSVAFGALVKHDSVFLATLASLFQLDRFLTDSYRRIFDCLVARFGCIRQRISCCKFLFLAAQAVLKSAIGTNHSGIDANCNGVSVLGKSCEEASR